MKTAYPNNHRAYIDKFKQYGLSRRFAACQHYGFECAVCGNDDIEQLAPAKPFYKHYVQRRPVSGWYRTILLLQSQGFPEGYASYCHECYMKYRRNHK